MNSMLLILILSAFLIPTEQSFYKAFQGNSEEDIEYALVILEKEGLTQTKNKAYKGALLTKKASFAKSPMKKLSIFKEGTKLLEEAISKDKNNAEYRFLRLVIQENAPALLGYNKSKEMDKQVIEQNFERLSRELRAYIKAYANQSKVLNQDTL